MSDRGLIEATIQTYFDCMFESSAEKAHAALHPNAKITGFLDGSRREMSVADFSKFVESIQPSPKAKGEAPRLDILSIEIAGDTAVALVRDDYIGKTFLDTLSLIKVHGTWSIYNKLFHVEGSSG